MCGFRKLLLQEDNEGCKRPLLSSLKKLVLLNTALSACRTLHLCDTLMNCVEQGVPLETLDLSECLASSCAVELLSEIVVEVLGPEEALEEEAQMISEWDSTAYGVKISPCMSQKRLRFGDDVGKREFIKFAKKYHQQLEEECTSIGRITVRAMSPP